eukprot:5762203-Amphidinium_carterae.1
MSPELLAPAEVSAEDNSQHTNTPEEANGTEGNHFEEKPGAELKEIADKRVFSALHSALHDPCCLHYSSHFFLKSKPLTTL